MDRMNSLATLLLFLLLVVGGGLLIGFVTKPDEWYANLKKPSFTPPSWIFAPVWTVLYVLIAIAGWRSWQFAQGGIAWKLWWAQLVLNFSWSPAFFGFQKIRLALGILILLLLAIIAFIAAEWSIDRWAAFLFVPYAGWAAFALLLRLRHRRIAHRLRASNRCCRCKLTSNLRY
jgi:translocator protein